MKIIEYSSYAVTLIIISIAIVYWIKNKIRPWRKIGFTLDNKTIPDIITGIILGVLAVSLIFLMDLCFNFIKIQEITFPQDVFFKFLLFLFIASFLEEFINRGLLVNGLSVFLKKNWQIIILVSIFFGMGHAAGENVTIISILSNALGGAIYTIAFLGAGNIWFPWALHFSWNTFQYVYGYPVSGLKYDSIVVQTDVKNTFFNGGSYGPEGGLIGLFFRIIIIISILLYFKRYRRIDIKEIFK